MIEASETTQLKEIIATASPYIKTIIDNFILPKLQNLKDKAILDYRKFHVPIEDHFSEYFHRTYKKVSVVNTLVFNNSQRFIKEIYLPLTLRQADSSDIKVKIDSFPHELINKYERILITDTAGMGKSTLMKKLFIDVIDEKVSVPILIELRRLNKGKKVLNEIQEQINAIEKDFNKTLLLELIKEGGFIIIFDGYDEVSLSDRDVVTSDIQDFINKAPNNKYVLTSRPENALTSFGDFQEFRIEPLKKKEAYELLRKYDRQGHVSSLLIRKLEETGMRTIDEFLTNPLLVSLLFTAFQHKQAIPFKKYLFYRQVYDANFETHDLTKGDSYQHDKYTNLEIDDFHRVLRHIGYSCLKNNQIIEYSKDEILELIRRAKQFCVGLQFSESDLLKDLLINVPLFTQDGNYIRWAHKSLQEYFAAQFIYLDTKEKQTHIIRQLYNHKSVEKFTNILDLYYDIDPKTFRNVIIYDFLKEYKHHHDTYLKQANESYDEEDIILRKELCFLEKPALYKVDDTREENTVNSDKFHKMIEETKARLSGTLRSPNIDKKLFCLLDGNVKNTILLLLANKNHPIISKVFQERNSEFKTSIEYEIQEEYKLVFVSGNIEEDFNSPKNFKEMNKMIIYSKIHPFKINSIKAIELLEEIENDLLNENLNSYSLEDL